MASIWARQYRLPDGPAKEARMGFIQIIDFRTSNFEELEKAEEEWRAATEGKRTIRREIATRDRNDPSHYVFLAFFDSYESAMENSALPETQASAERFAALTEDLTFADLEIIDER
jgi:hypothetical protein